MEKDAKILVTGSKGMVGSAISRALEQANYSNIINANHSEVDFTNQQETNNFFASSKPDYVFLAAAKVGGIYANNTYPANFIYDNLMIASNIIYASYHYQVKRLLFLGSSCIYPKYATQPMTEKALLTGILEPTNEPYAIAKIAGIKLCESFNRQYKTDFRSIMPTNVYGIGDNFHLENSHVAAAILRKLHIAKINKLSKIALWGSGSPKREFIFADDLADASLFIMDIAKEDLYKHTDDMCSHINVGPGADISIKDLANLVKEIVGFQGDILWDNTMPDGTLRKLMDVSLLKKMGWQTKTDIKQGMEETYRWFLENESSLRL